MPDPSPRARLTSVKPAPAELTMEGPGGAPKTYRFPRLTLDGLRRLQAWIDANAPSPLQVTALHLHGVPEDVARRALDQALEATDRWAPPRIGTPEAEALLGSMDGLRQVVATMLRSGQPGIADAEVDAVVAQLDGPAIGRILDVPGGAPAAAPAAKAGRGGRAGEAARRRARPGGPAAPTPKPPADRDGA
jgi:hypothetical protein